MRRSLFALLAFYILATASTAALVDEIWLAKQPSFSIVYIVTSGTADATAALLQSFATLHFSRAQRVDDSMFYDGSHSCAESSSWTGGQPDGAEVCPPPELFDHPLRTHRKARARESYFRKAKLWRVARAAFAASDYFVFLDLSGMGWPSLSAERLVKYERLLEQERPAVAVPMHPCNADVSCNTDDGCNADYGSAHSALISSIYDTRFVAVHSTATNLLLPLHESVLSLICFLMLRGKVSQFDTGILALSASLSSPAECFDADLGNQDAIVNFVSSLRSEHHALALPFSPRIRAPAAPHPPAVEFTEAGLIPSLDGNCPVDCSFNYWRTHPAFECCSFAPHVSYSNNAADNYIKLSKRWMLPHPDALSGVLMSHNHSYGPADFRQHGFFKSHQFVPLPLPTVLTHAPQSFQIVLSGGPVVLLDSACPDEGEEEHSDLLQQYRLFVVPERMMLRSNSSAADAVLDIGIQVTLSASEALGGGDDQCVILGRIDVLKVSAGCGSNEPSHTTMLSFDVMASTINQHANGSTLAASFYSPGLPWFDLASNLQKDVLRRRSVNASMRTQCLDVAHVAAEAAVTVRKFCPQSRRDAVCVSRVLTASSQTVSHHSREERLRSSFVTETRPSDMYDEAAARAPMRRLQSDFACAGPNRRWPFVDESDKFSTGPDVRYSICLLRNVCWMNKRMTLFVPDEFSHLGDFLDFNNVSLGEPPHGGQPHVTGFNPVFEFGQSVPAHARFAANLTHYSMSRHFHGILGSFGHSVWEELGGVFHAMHLFDLPRDDGRIVWFNQHGFPRATPYFFPRTPAYISEYDDGTCFEHMVVGFRGVNSFTHGFSLHRSAHAVEFRKHYLSLFGLQHLTSKRRRRQHVFVNLYPKWVTGNAEVWSDVCRLAQDVELLFPRLHFRCVVLHEMSVEVQVQVIAEATIHVWPNGGSSYGLIFAGDGTSVILLSEEAVKDTHQLGHLPWVTVYYLLRKEEHLFATVFLRALHAAAARMDLCPDTFSPGASSSGCFDAALLVDV